MRRRHVCVWISRQHITADNAMNYIADHAAGRPATRQARQHASVVSYLPNALASVDDHQWRWQSICRRVRVPCVRSLAARLVALETDDSMDSYWGRNRL